MKLTDDRFTRSARISIVMLVIVAGIGCCECENDGNQGTIENVQTIENVVTVKNIENIENVAGPIISRADHWLVIHDNVKELENDDGDLIGCESAANPDEEDQSEVTFLPDCLHTKQGEKVGFANFSKCDVTIRHFLTLDAPNPIQLAAGESGEYEVSESDTAVLFEIVCNGITSDHGGPDMIVEP